MEDTNLRPTWDDYFMAITKIVATRGTCDRLRAGAVLVKNKRIIATGYNGSPPGQEHCDEVGHLLEEGHCIRTIHAEHNVILQSAVLSGASTEGATLYTKYNPCMHCAKYVVAAGVRRVVIGKIYRGEVALKYLMDAGVQIELYKENSSCNTVFKKLFEQEIEEKKTVEGDVRVSVVK